MPDSQIATENATCSKCTEELDTTGYPLWCKKCRAKNKRDYEATRKEMQESRGYAAGVSAMREYLVKNFAQYGTSGSFTGREIAETIRRVRGPFEPRPVEAGDTVS